MGDDTLVKNFLQIPLKWMKLSPSYLKHMLPYLTDYMIIRTFNFEFQTSNYTRDWILAPHCSS